MFLIKKVGNWFLASVKYHQCLHFCTSIFLHQIISQFDVVSFVCFALLVKILMLALLNSHWRPQKTSRACSIKASLPNYFCFKCKSTWITSVYAETPTKLLSFDLNCISCFYFYHTPNIGANLFHTDHLQTFFNKFQPRQSHLFEMFLQIYVISYTWNTKCVIIHYAFLYRTWTMLWPKISFNN